MYSEDRKQEMFQTILRPVLSRKAAKYLHGKQDTRPLQRFKGRYTPRLFEPHAEGF